MRIGIDRIIVLAIPINKPTKKPMPIGFCMILGTKREPYSELFVTGLDKIYCSPNSSLMQRNYT